MRSILLLLPLLLVAIQVPASTDDTEVINGGRLYDKWWKDTHLPEPKETHPAYPAGGKKTGSATWRCKECHGWDYKGSAGAYRAGSHFTGIKGIRGQSGKDPAQIEKILNGESHGYGLQLSQKDLRDLALFVSKGQIDVDKYIDAKTGAVHGDAGKGKEHYRKECKRCHGEEGQALNFAAKGKNPLFVGDLARKNPWEILHKIRFGHPGAKMDMKQMHSREAMSSHHKGKVKMWEAMPPMYSKLSVEQQVDLLAYITELGD